MSEWNCKICVSTFTTKQGYDRHVGNGHYIALLNHVNRRKEVDEALKIWAEFHPRKGEMPIGPKMKKDAEPLPAGISVVVPPGQMTEGDKGTIPCTRPKCKGAAHPYVAGYNNYKIFEDVAYKLSGLADCKTLKFVYVQSCIAHPLYRYDGKFCGQNEHADLAQYICLKLTNIRVLRTFLEKKFKGEKPTEQEYVDFILFLRRIKSMEVTEAYVKIFGEQSDEKELEAFTNKLSSLKPSDAYLHFCREDCHPANMRIDVIAVYTTREKVNAAEKHMHSVSGSDQWWRGGHNLINENTRGQCAENRPPTAFCMLAPLDCLANMELFMRKHGIDKGNHYQSTDLCSVKKSTTDPGPSSSKSAEDIMEEKIQYVYDCLGEYDRQKAIDIIGGLRLIDEKHAKKIRLD